MGEGSRSREVEWIRYEEEQKEGLTVHLDDGVRDLDLLERHFVDGQATFDQ